MPLNNAILHVEHLREQGVEESKALAHAAQRFGVLPATLKERMDGKVADRNATREALAAARSHLIDPDVGVGRPDEEAVEILRNLYVAITGEQV